MNLRLEPTSGSATVQPAFRKLGPEECRIVLARNHIGRLAHSLFDHVGIEPMAYVYRENALWGRTGPGVKTRVLERNPRVAFQVDEIEGMFRWRSVVARGEFAMLSAAGSENRLRAWREALDAARLLLPETFTERDPVPFRTILFRIAISTVSGVEADQR
jgi:uncharacterized protein